jgi:uncharacterized protein (UPF0332 family)
MFPREGCLQLAKDLITNPDDASLRSAVNRAYYASFHQVKLFAQKSGIPFSSGKRSQIHRDILNFMKSSENTAISSLGGKFDRLQIDRNKCDYADNIKGLDRKAKAAVLAAEAIFKGIIV